MARGIDPRWQAQLAQDLATGSPIPYRRVPGRARRQYYNPQRPYDEPVSEHYVVRIYKPALSELERSRITELVRANIRQQNIVRRNLADTWRLRAVATGMPPGITDINSALRHPRFRTEYNRFRELAWEARHTVVGSDARTQAFAPDSEYSIYLQLMGRRTGDEDFPIGESPEHVNQGQSYIDTTVVPFYDRWAELGRRPT